MPEPMSSTTAADVVASALQAQSHEGIPFSLELSQDQRDVRDWVHGFAEKVVRPAAHEWMSARRCRGR